MPGESLGWPVQTAQTQDMHSYPKRGHPLLCGVCSAAALEPSKCSWHLWECSVFLTDHPLGPPVCCQVPLQKQVNCLAQIRALQLELHSGFVAKAVSQACLPKLGIWPFQLWSQRQLALRRTTLNFTWAWAT